MILECIPDYQNIEEWAALAEEFGMNFEYNEFFRPDILSDPKKIDEIISLYHGLGRDTSDDTLHGAFYDINISSYDPLIRDASDYRVKQSIDIAEQLGVRGVVFHTNYLSDFKSEAYRSSWVESNILYWTDLCKKHPGVEVYLENMFDESPELLSKVANEMRYVRNFGVCLDLAHAFLSAVPVYDWITALSREVRHIHINDNDGLQDLHLPVGSGAMDWSVLSDSNLLRNDPSVLIEVSGIDRLRDSINYLKTIGFIA